ncbi:S41 family peptidase [Poriferisphaera sp. WC338]|uniref:S41 family peptidase n=1 Tax=Poriferisphaera sp. WC338 TaxID=3425129 RepID=UPI003D81A762
MKNEQARCAALLSGQKMITSLISVLALALGVGVSTLQADENAAETAKVSNQYAAEPVTYQSLIQNDDYASLTEAIKQLDQTGQVDHQQAENLLNDIATYQEHQAARDKKGQASYEEAFGKMLSALDEDRLEDAMVAAIEAHSLSKDSTNYLQQQEVLDLVAQAEAKAKAAEESGNWVDVLSTYRLLDLLYENQDRYRDRVKLAAKHVRLLQIYVPEHLQNIYKERAIKRAEEKGEDAPPPMDIEIESWTKKLKNVNLSMLRDSLRKAARFHVERYQPGHNGYVSLVDGGVSNLLILLDNKTLAEEFPSLKNEDNVSKFKDYLVSLKAEVNRPGNTMNFLDAFKAIDKIINQNDLTVDLPHEVVIYEMTEGAMSQLDDFTAVIWPEDIEHFSRSTEGKFVGIGIQITRKDGQLTVVTPLPNTPAHRAGIKDGDVIVKVDGANTATWSLNRAVSEITGKEGTKVNLSIERPGETALIEKQITRKEIAIESIRGWQHTDAGDWDYWVDPDAGIGYVRLSQFLPQSADDLDAAVAQLQAQGKLNGLILDLRFNPGGLMHSAIQISDRFIDEGPIVSTVDANGNQKAPDVAHKANSYKKFPVVVLVNQGSASASEIVSGALQDYGRATIIGTRSFGKGSVQDVHPIARRSAYLKLTTQYYQLPNGRIVHRKPGAKDWGINPDIEIPMSTQEIADAIEYRQEVDIIHDENWQPEEGEAVKEADDILANGLDPQLESALIWLKLQQVTGGKTPAPLLQSAKIPSEEPAKP